MLRTKQREEIIGVSARRVCAAKVLKRSDDEGHLAHVFPAEPAHHQVKPDLHPLAPREPGIDEVGRAFCDFAAIQHGITAASRGQLRFRWCANVARTFVRAR
jgi:hypothetical protein